MRPRGMDTRPSRRCLIPAKSRLARRYQRPDAPCSGAAENGREAVVKVLLDSGKVKADSKDENDGQARLSPAAENGQEPVVKALPRFRQSRSRLEGYLWPDAAVEGTGTRSPLRC
jgi:hypothetical protein